MDFSTTLRASRRGSWRRLGIVIFGSALAVVAATAPAPGQVYLDPKLEAPSSEPGPVPELGAELEKPAVLEVAGSAYRLVAMDGPRPIYASTPMPTGLAPLDAGGRPLDRVLGDVRDHFGATIDQAVAVYVDGAAGREALATWTDHTRFEASSTAGFVAQDLLRLMPEARLHLLDLEHVAEPIDSRVDGARWALWAGTVAAPAASSAEDALWSRPGIVGPWIRGVDARLARSGLLLVVPAGEVASRTLGGPALGRNVLVVAAAGAPLPVPGDRVRPDLTVRLPDLDEDAEPLSRHLTAAIGTGAAVGQLMAVERSLGLSTLGAATYRALLVHTAVDSGEPGPDGGGWGLLSLGNAVERLESAAAGDGFIGELVLRPGERVRLRFTGDGSPRRATLAWDDAGSTGGTGDWPRRQLDLVARVADRSVHPWVLDPLAPERPARRAVDRRSNLEQLDVEASPETEEWTVVVTHAGGEGPQRLSLVVSGGTLLEDPAALERQRVDLGDRGDDAEARERAAIGNVASDPPVFFQPSVESGQVAKFTGAASYSFPIDVPAGPGGLSIPLTLSYNSDLASARNTEGNSDGGWVGLGWTLDVGRVELTGGVSGDHRVSLGGESATLTSRESTSESCSDQDGWTCDGQVVKRYNTEKARFWKIQKTSRTWRDHVCACTDPNTCTWPTVEGFIRDDSKIEIWNRGGVRYDFGVAPFDALPWNGWSQATSSRVFYLKHRDGYGPDHKEAWYRGWGLEKVQDPVGNTLEVSYRSYPSQSWSHNCSGLPNRGWKETYPHKIRYSTNPSAGDDHAEWEVEFSHSGKGIDTLADHAIAQSGILLDGIRVWFRPLTGSPVLMREYVFVYDDDRSDDTTSYRLRQILQYGKGGANGGHELPAATMSYALKTVMKNGVMLSRYFLTSVEHRGATVSWAYENHDNTEYRKQRVRSRTVDPGAGVTETVDYTYLGERVKTEDDGTRRLIGFQQVNEDFANRREATYFHVLDEDDEYALNGKTGWHLVEHLNGVDRTKTEWVWSLEERFEPGTSDNAGWFLRLDAVKDWMWDEGGFEHSKKVTYSYHPGSQGGEQYGNVTAIREYDAVSASTPFRSTWSPHAVNTGAWIVDKKRMDAVFAGDLFAGDYVKKTYYVWEPDDTPRYYTVDASGLLYAQREFLWNGGNERVVDTRYVYDDYGNRTRTSTFNSYGTVAAYASGQARDTDVVYDPSFHIFPTRVTNPLGHRADTYYYDVNETSPLGEGLPGQIQAIRDIANGDWIEARQYDAFGRQVYSWKGSPADWWILSRASLKVAYDDDQRMRRDSVRADDGSHALHLDSWTFYDGLGRPIQTQRKWSASEKQIVNTRYDAQGKVSSVTVPRVLAWGDDQFHAGEYDDPSLPASRKTYDVLGRVQLNIHPDDSERHSVYWGPWGDVAVINETDRRKVHRKMDTRGNNYQTYERDETTGTMYYTDYAHDALGRLTSIEDHAGNEISFTYDELGRKLQEDDPDRGVTSYAYDPRGNLLEIQNAEDERICWWYDALDRPIAKQLQTGACGGTIPAGAMLYHYDHAVANAMGRLWRAENDDVVLTYAYDSRGRQTSETVDVAGAPEVYTTSWSYDERDLPASMVYPDGREVIYGINPYHGLPKTLSVDGTPYVIRRLYNERGQPTRLDWGNGLQNRWVYYGVSDNYRLKQIRVGTPTEIERDEHFYYWWNDAGNVIRMRDYRGLTPAGNSTFQDQLFAYDFLDRLTRAYTLYVEDGGYDLSFNYNAIGNLFRVVDDGEVTTYGYGSRPHAKTKVNGEIKMWYDDAGRMDRRQVGATETIYSWNAEGRLIGAVSGASSLAFLRDIDGKLVKKVGDGLTTYYIGDHFEVTAGASTDSPPAEPCCDDIPPVVPSILKTRSYYFFGGERVVQHTVASSGATATRYLHGDHLGTATLITDETGVVRERKRMRPFGAERWASGSDQNDLGFAGERSHDGMAGVYEMGIRFYDPHYRQWLSPDPTLPDLGDPQKLNRYAYVTNNPVRLVDPTGFDGEDCEPPSPWQTLLGTVDHVETWVNGMAPSFSHFFGIGYAPSLGGTGFLKKTAGASPINPWVGPVVDVIKYGGAVHENGTAYVNGDINFNQYYLLNAATLGEAQFDLTLDALTKVLYVPTGGRSTAIFAAKEGAGVFATLNENAGWNLNVGDPTVAFGQLKGLVTSYIQNPNIRATINQEFGWFQGPYAPSPGHYAPPPAPQSIPVPAPMPMTPTPVRPPMTGTPSPTGTPPSGG